MAGVAPIRRAYCLLGIAISPLLYLWLKRRAIRGREIPARMGERFGHACIPRPAGALVWLHAASIGETQSVLTLVRALLRANPQIHLLVTTGTVTSAALVAQQNIPCVIHQFVPLDTCHAVRRFLQHWQPDVALWVESELWPQLLWQAQARRIPMLLINARISARTYADWKRWPNTISSLLQSFCGIYAGSTEDAERIRALGGISVHDTGNLKYDADPLPVDAAQMDALSRICTGRRVFVAASTHANEEQSIAQAHRIAAQQFPDLLTIIVPRHASRGNAIATDLRARGFTVAQRSAQEAISDETAIYLADTMGELGSFYRLSDIVFMGGSLIAHGGQNPLEAARLGNAIISGAHTHNFAAIMRQLAAAGAVSIVADALALAGELTRLLADDEARRAMAEHAEKLVEQASGASAVILQHCEQLITKAGV